MLTLIVRAHYSTPIGGASLNEPAMTEYQTHTSRPGVIGPIGKCIYGADHPTDDLSKEHVLPFGLSGGVVLTKASCGDCRDITSAFERTCLQHNFGMIRAHQEMPTRRPAERPTQGKLSVYNDGAKDVQEVPLAEHPNILALPEFSAIPAYLTGNLTRPHVAMRMYGKADEIRRRASLHAGEIVAVEGSFDMDAFVRLLAKIGHGMMWASFKTDNIRPLLIPIILDGNTADAWRLIGAGCRPVGQFSPTLGAGANFVRCEIAETPDRGIFVITTIQLFAEWGTPTYSVICGETDHVPPAQTVNR